MTPCPNLGRCSVLLAAAAMWTLAASAQQEAPGYSELLDVAIVNVDLVVLDREGNRVQGLTREHFELLENGLPQKITHFTGYTFDARGPAQAGKAGVKSDRPPFHVALYVDEGVYDRRAQRDIEQVLLDFFAAHLRADDRVDVFAWNRSLVRLSPQLTDGDAVVDAVRNAFKTARAGGLRAPRLDERALRAEQQFERTLAELNDFEELPGDRATPSILTATRLAAADQTENVRLKTRALRDVALQMGESSGRKALLILSSTFGRYEASRLFTEDPGVEGIPASAREYDTRGDAHELARAANAAGVTVYSLYPGTRESDFPDALQDVYRETGGIGSTLPLRIADTDTLAFLASTTGGVVALSPNGIRDTLPGIGEDLSSYYSLAYRSNLEDGETRRLEVRTTIPGLTVRSRDAVTRAPAAQRMAARVLNNVFQRSNSSIRLKVEVSPPSQRSLDPRAAVDITLRFPAIDLLLIPDEETAKGRFTVSIAAGDENFGRLSEVSSERRTFEVPLSRVSELGAHEIVYRTTVKFQKNTTVISVGVRDEESDVSGFVRVGINRSKGKKS